MQKPLSLAPCLILLGLFGCANSPEVQPQVMLAVEADPIHLVVLHTNDLHGQAAPRSATWLDREDPPALGGLARLTGEIHALAKSAVDSGAAVLVLDGGDWYQGTPEGLVDGGGAFVNLLGEVGYDAMVVGNHEFDHGVAHLEKLIAKSGVPATLANVRIPATGKRVTWAEPFRIINAGMGASRITVAVVGFVSKDTPSITHADARSFDFIDPVVEFERVVADAMAANPDIDLVIPVTHIGVSADRELAAAFPDLDLIVGGHSHTTLKNGVREGETLIVQTGCKATVLGRVDLYLDRNTFEVLNSSAQLIELRANAERTNTAIAQACAKLVDAGAAEMDAEVGVLSEDLFRSRGMISGSAGNWITDVMRARLGSDVAVQNRGGIRRNLDAGMLTRRDLFEVLPFGNTLVEVELTGAELTELARRAVADRDHSGIEFSGMRLVYAGAWPDSELVRVMVAGKPVAMDARYRLATNSFLAGGGDRYIPELEKLAGRAEMIDTGLILRDLMEEALAEGSGLRVDAGNRYVIEE